MRIPTNGEIATTVIRMIIVTTHFTILILGTKKGSRRKCPDPVKDASAGFEPAYAALQTATCPLGHEALMGGERIELSLSGSKPNVFTITPPAIEYPLVESNNRSSGVNRMLSTTELSGHDPFTPPRSEA